MISDRELHKELKRYRKDSARITVYMRNGAVHTGEIANEGTWWQDDPSVWLVTDDHDLFLKYASIAEIQPL